MSTKKLRTLRVAAVIVALGSLAVAAQQVEAPQVTFQNVRDGLKDPTRWLTYGGDYGSQRHSPLTQITPQNVQRLTPQWAFQTDTLGKFEATPIVLDGVIYITGPEDLGWALDARTGRQIWRYKRDVAEWDHRLLRPRQPRLCGDGRPPVQDDARRPPRGDQLEERHDSLGHGDGEFPERLQRHAGAARLQGQGRCGYGRGRIRSPGLHRCLRHSHGEKSLEVLYDRRSRRPGPPNVAGAGREGLGARRRFNMDDRLLRSGTESGFLGHRQCRTRLQRRRSAKATTCTPHRSSRSTAIPGSCAGITNSRRTTSGTGTRLRCPCWPM